MGGGERSTALDERCGSNSAASRIGTSLALLAIVAGALLPRLHNLDQWGLWDDELFTVSHAIELAGFVNTRALAWLPGARAADLVVWWDRGYNPE